MHSDLERLSLDASACTSCRLCEQRTTVVFGSGAFDARLFVIGEAPGREEDLTGRPFVGRSGRLLDELLEDEIGLSREECYVANVVKCRPPQNRDPMADEVASCRHFLDAQLAAVKPSVVLSLGNFATRALLDTAEGITRLHGRRFPLASSVLVPTFHPAAALRGGAAVLDQMRADFQVVADVIRGAA